MWSISSAGLSLHLDPPEVIHTNTHKQLINTFKLTQYIITTRGHQNSSPGFRASWNKKSCCSKIMLSDSDTTVLNDYHIHILQYLYNYPGHFKNCLKNDHCYPMCVREAGSVNWWESNTYVNINRAEFTVSCDSPCSSAT